MTSCILMSRSSSVAADTASFTRGKTKAGMRTRVAGKTGSESMSLLREECDMRTWSVSGIAVQTLQSGHAHQASFFPTASMATSKNIYSAFWDDSGFYSESRTHLLAAFIMTGCVKYNARILGVSMLHYFILTNSSTKKFEFFCPAL